MLRRLGNFIGRMSGYSCCLNCGDFWNWKHGHMIGCSAHERKIMGMWPVCHECFEKLSPEAILDFANELLSTWIEGKPWTYPEDVVASMRKAIRESIQTDKQAGISPRGSYYTPLHRIYYRALCKGMAKRCGPMTHGRQAYLISLAIGFFSGLLALSTGIAGFVGGYGAAVAFFGVFVFTLIRFKSLWNGGL